jgi:4-hydroxy-4-methyl-2-oxoglutarate aldolase
MYHGDLKHPDTGKVYRKFKRPDQKYVALFSQMYTGFVFERLGKQGAMHPSIKPLDYRWKICGPALTILGPELSVRRMAMNLAEPGDVLVIAANANTEYSCFGDGTARNMRRKGLPGIVIDGVTRDVPRLIAMNFATFCRGGAPRNYDYPVFRRFGAINIPVSCGGVIVHPGDLILGDGDGVIVIPQSFLPTLAEGLMKDFIAESAERVGRKEYLAFPVEDELKTWGYQFFDHPYGEDVLA